MHRIQLQLRASHRVRETRRNEVSRRHQRLWGICRDRGSQQNGIAGGSGAAQPQRHRDGQDKANQRTAGRGPRVPRRLALRPCGFCWVGTSPVTACAVSRWQPLAGMRAGGTHHAPSGNTRCLGTYWPASHGPRSSPSARRSCSVVLVFISEHSK